MCRLWGVLFFFLATCQCVNAGVKDPNDPNILLQKKWDAIFSILQNKDIKQKEKTEELNKVTRPIFDFPLMAKLALGKKNWLKLNSQQREKFTRLFVERISTSYSEKIILYTDQKVSFKPAVKKGKSTYVSMELISKSKTTAVVYKLRKVEKRWKIYDVEIEGVSVLLTYRSQFNDILRRGTVEEFLSLLEKPPAD